MDERREPDAMDTDHHFCAAPKRFFTLFDIRFTDLLNLLAVGKKSTLNDDIDVLLGKPAKGFFQPGKCGD